MRAIADKLCVTLRGRRIISEFSHEFKAGEVVALLGASGIGKTTLLRVLAGLVQPDALRQFSWLDQAGKPMSSPRPIGYVRQREPIPEWLTVERFLRMCLVGAVSNGVDSRVVIGERLRTVDVDPDQHASKYPHELSGGLTTRVAVAGAMATDARVLLFDEPLAMLDDITRLAVLPAVKHALRRPNTLGVMATHSVREAAYVADRLIVFRGFGKPPWYGEYQGFGASEKQPEELEIKQLQTEIRAFVTEA
jgi:ABC-type nitrate/sulfonate/bicarbonate transport system ATPase subunit